MHDIVIGLFINRYEFGLWNVPSTGLAHYHRAGIGMSFAVSQSRITEFHANALLVQMHHLAQYRRKQQYLIDRFHTPPPPAPT